MYMYVMYICVLYSTLLAQLCVCYMQVVTRYVCVMSKIWDFFLFFSFIFFFLPQSPLVPRRHPSSLGGIGE